MLRPRLVLSALAISLLVSSGCVSSRTSPRGVVPSSKAAPADPYGAWVSILSTDGRTLPGELIAVDADSAYVLTVGHRLTAIALVQVQSARLEAYRNDVTTSQAWAGLGALSTFTHGFFLPITAPLWGVAGIAASVPDSRLGFFNVPSEMTWVQAGAYARFPAGLPPGLDASRLRFLGRY